MVRASSLIAGRRFQLLLLVAAMATGGYVRTAVSPLQEAIRTALFLSDTQMAFLQGPVIGIPLAITAIPLGLLIDRYSRKRLLLTLLALSLIGSMLTAIASNFTLLLLARGLAGLMGLSILPVVFSLLADLYPPELRGRVTTAVVVGQVAGNSAAFALGGALLAAGSAPGSWRWAMLGLLVPLAPVLLLMTALRELPRTGPAGASPSAAKLWKGLRRTGVTVGPLAIGVVLVETAVGAMLIWSAPMLSRRFSLAPDAIGAIMAIGMLASGILGPLFGGTLADLCQRAGGPRRTVSVLIWLALLSVPASLFAFMPNVVETCVLLITSMTLMLAMAIMGLTLITIVIPDEIRGLCMSVLLAAILLFALAVAPVTVSLLSEAIGGLATIGKALSIICATAGLLAAATFAYGRHHVSTRRRELDA
jgi:MFS family permease